MTAVLSLVAAAASETGLVRRNNEDAAYSGHWLFAVADGMGGHAAGKVASAAVIESLRPHDADVGADALLEVLGHAVTESNAEVAQRAAEDPARSGMGTILTAMLWSGHTASYARSPKTTSWAILSPTPGRWPLSSRGISTAGRIGPRIWASASCGPETAT